jgi:phosphoenolpyruvate---glycerone phosphotransferase subunit DhaM
VSSQTVGIVLISHSPLLAQGAAELAAEMCGGRVPIAHAGGTDDGRLGTSIALLEQAVQSVMSDMGVAIIPDLGSSVLTARTLLEDDENINATIVDAPFVEGAIAAVVTAAAGLSLAQVVEAAEETRGLVKL